MEKTGSEAPSCSCTFMFNSTDLILPGDGTAARSKLGVEVAVSLVQVYSFNGGELLDVQDILTVHGSGLDRDKTGDRRQKGSSQGHQL